MAIRMKEWGMMRAPAEAVHIPTQGLKNWDSAAMSWGTGVASVLQGSAELVEGRKRVQQAGELAAFSERLRSIGQETSADMEDCDVKDWDYAWQAAIGPRLAEAVAELPPDSREAGQALAQAFNKQASLEAFRAHSVQSLQNARRNWQERLDRAVEQGDEQQARQWLEQGKGVFVPENEQESAEREVGSRACLSRWRQGVEQDAMGALERWWNATPDQLPAGREQQDSLTNLMQNTRLSARQALAQQVSQELCAGRDIPDAVWGRACRAGLISKEQRERTGAGAGESPAELCSRLRRVDEVEDSDEARLAMLLDIATAPLPVAKRRELLQRLETGGRVARPDRLALSRHLWNLYNRGAFGCPGDAMACRRMADLQSQGLQLLASEGTDAAARWVEAQHRCDNRWVCFSDSHAKA